MNYDIQYVYGEVILQQCRMYKHRSVSEIYNTDSPVQT